MLLADDRVEPNMANQNGYIEGIESFTFGSVAVFFVVFHLYFLCCVAAYKRENRCVLAGARHAGAAHHAKVAAMVEKRAEHGAVAAAGSF